MLAHYRTALLSIGVLLVAGPRTVVGQFVAGPPLDQHEYVDLVGDLYEQVAQDLNDVLALPREVRLTSGSCGEVTAFYQPASGGSPSQIVLCTELIRAIYQQSQGQREAHNQVEWGLFSQLSFVLFHEVGHALIDVLELPIVGQEEDVVDQLATLLFAEEPILAMWAAVFWAQGAQSRGRFVSMESFADTHDLNEQRVFNIACWTYGADPLVRAYVTESLGLPAQRAQRCQTEYDRMRRGWEQLLAQHLKDPGNFFAANPKRNASGYWRFMESMTDTNMQVRCSASGTLALWQMTDQISGSMSQEGSCVMFGLPTDNNASAQIASGRVTESGLSFDIADCRYEGSFEDDGRMALSGSMVCALQLTNQTLELKGQWHAVR